MSGHQNALRPRRSIGPMVHDPYVTVGRGFTRRTAKKVENSPAGRNDRAYPAAIAGPPITPAAAVGELHLRLHNCGFWLDQPGGICRGRQVQPRGARLAGW